MIIIFIFSMSVNIYFDFDNVYDLSNLFDFDFETEDVIKKREQF